MSFSSLCTRLKCLPRLPLSPPPQSPGCLCCIFRLFLHTIPPSSARTPRQSPNPPGARGHRDACRGVPGHMAQLQSRGQQEQEESARSCQLPQARVTGHRPLACPHPWPALAHPWGPGLRGIVFTPGLPTPLSLDILSPPSLFPPSLQRHEDGGLLWDSEAWPRQGCHVPSCFLCCRLS